MDIFLFCLLLLSSYSLCTPAFARVDEDAAPGFEPLPPPPRFDSLNAPAAFDVSPTVRPATVENNPGNNPQLPQPAARGAAADVQQFNNTALRISDPTGGKSIIDIFQAILDVLLVFAVPIVVFFIVWAGFLYVTAQGDTTKVSQAHKALLYAVVGGVIVVGAKVILSIIQVTISQIVGGP